MKNNEFDIIFKLIDRAVVGVDTYNHNDSRWLIFTDNKRWVIELTKEGTLWYNYYFFKNIFKLISLDVVETQHYITKWVEDTVINGVKDTKPNERLWQAYVEDTIQNGVKKTDFNMYRDNNAVKDTIQYGVKRTIADDRRRGWPNIEDAIQNGVKKTYSDKIPHEYDWTNQFTEEIEGIIQNGVKHTEKSLQIDGSCVIEDVLMEGVKHTEYGDWLDGDERFDDIIDNGIKETHDDAYHHTGRVGGVIKNGVKEIKTCELHSLMNADHIIRDGVKERKSDYLKK